MMLSSAEHVLIFFTFSTIFSLRSSHCRYSTVVDVVLYRVGRFVMITVVLRSVEHWSASYFCLSLSDEDVRHGVCEAFVGMCVCFFKFFNPSILSTC